MEGDLGWCRGGGSSSNNWDLHAVVRLACGDAAPSSSVPPSDDADDAFPWPGPLQPLLTDPAVDGLCQALLAAPKQEAAPLSSPRNEAPATTQQPAPPAEEAPAKPLASGRGGGRPTRSKRKSKKSQVNKEVTRVAAGAPSPDLWAWRKYGQKPIKGSPYPRGYYRCSTDKDCKARKQVERCRDDPGTLIVTYTGEHSHPVPLHRSSLAGTTRSKPQQQPSAASPTAEETESQQAQSPALASSTAEETQQQGTPSACTGLSPSTPLRLPSVGVEYEDEEDDDTLAVRLLLEDTEMAAEDDALLFFQPDEPAPLGVPGSGVGCDDVMLLPKPEEPAPMSGNGSGVCDDAKLFHNNKPDEPAGPPGTVSSGGGAEDVNMLFPKPREPQGPQGPQRTMVSAGIANVDGGTASVINFVDEKFSVSGRSAWEAAAAAAASGWGL